MHLSISLCRVIAVSTQVVAGAAALTNTNNANELVSTDVTRSFGQAVRRRVRIQAVFRELIVSCFI